MDPATNPESPRESEPTPALAWPDIGTLAGVAKEAFQEAILAPVKLDCADGMSERDAAWAESVRAVIRHLTDGPLPAIGEQERDHLGRIACQAWVHRTNPGAKDHYDNIPEEIKECYREVGEAIWTVCNGQQAYMLARKAMAAMKNMAFREMQAQLTIASLEAALEDARNQGRNSIT